MTEPPRRLPALWTAEENQESFTIKDATGRSLAYVYFEEEAGRRSQLNRLTRDEARRVATAIARIPEAQGKPES